VPFPLPAVEVERVPAVRVATCGLALQACPTKEALAGLPLAELRPAELAALSQVEGELAMAWAIERFPGLERDLRALLPTLRPTSHLAGNPVLAQGEFVADARRMIDVALERARRRGRAELAVPELLGLLPLDESARRSLRSRFRALGHMPYSLRKDQPQPAVLAIPVGGTGGARSRNLPPPNRPEESDPESRADRRVGIPYDEWNRFTRRYRRGHVSVLERRLAAAEGRATRPAPELLRWFRQSPSRVWRSRLEEGTELDVDAFVDEWVAQAADASTAAWITAIATWPPRSCWMAARPSVPTAVCTCGSSSPAPTPWPRRSPTPGNPTPCSRSPATAGIASK
jgi:hypothetical protein